MKTCNRCKKQQIERIHRVLTALHINVAISGPVKSSFSEPIKYTENKVNENGLCNSCQIEVNKLEYDAKYFNETI